MTGSKIILEGMTVEQFRDLIEATVDHVIAKRESKPKSIADSLPDEVPVKQALYILRYKTAAPLRKYHHKKNGLTPIRRGRHLFYSKDELLQLKNRLFR